MVLAEICFKRSIDSIDSAVVKFIEMDLFSELKNLRVLLVDDDEWIRLSSCQV
jgi:hypothetical protein